VTLALGLMTAVMWAFSDLLSQRVSRGTGALSATFWVLLAGCIPATALALVVEGVPELGRGWVGLAAVAGAIDVVGIWFMMHALAVGSLAVVVPIVALEGGIAALGSVLLLGDRISPLLAAGLPLAVAGGALAAAGPGNRTAVGARDALVCAISFAGVLLVFATVDGVGALTLVATARVVSTILIAPVAAVRRAPLLPPRVLAVGAIGATLDTVAFSIYTHAARLGPMSVAAVASAQFATFGVLLGLFVLKERPLRRQLVGVSLTVLAVSLLALGE
jgi:drug/metabolite transporter (DMT)-like permease